MPKVRLIDEDALRMYCEKRHCGSVPLEYIKQLRPVFAEPVKRGRMIEGRYPNENKCSECGQEFRDDIGFIIQDDDGVFHYPKRCPECGCYWDGGADND